MLRKDAIDGSYQTVGPESAPYAITCAAGTTAYADFPVGEYDCWAPAAAATDHFRWAYLAMLNPTSPPTIAAASFPAPTASVSAQVSGVPTGAAGAGMAPGTALVRLYVAPGYRLAILCTSAVTLYCSRVL